jgi:hypothetical protein
MRTVTLALALSVAFLFAAPAAEAQGHRGKVRWVGDLAAGLRQAGDTGKPVMLLFSANW